MTLTIVTPLIFLTSIAIIGKAIQDIPVVIFISEFFRLDFKEIKKRIYKKDVDFHFVHCTNIIIKVI